jgi:integrase
MSWQCASMMWRPTAIRSIEQRSARRRLVARSGSDSPSRRGRAIDEYLRPNGRKPGEFLFAGRGGNGYGLTTRQYARLVGQWVASIGLDPLKFGTHSLRRTKATLIYRRTGNLRAVQLLLGHTKIESTVRYLGIEIDNAIEIAEKIEV